MKQNNLNSSQKGIADNGKAIAMKVSKISIIVNVLLSLLKLVAGVVAKSGAMVSDAIHSASDVFSTFIVIIGVNIAAKKEDEEHPYGHERLESVASVILAVILAFTGLGIGFTGVKKITGGNYGALQVPGILALIAAIVSIVVKEWMYWYTRAAAKKINSGALMADAWHHRSDALSSVGSFVGIFGARMGYPILDPIASVVICIFIEKASIDIFRDAMNKMVDRSCSEEVISEMKEVILEVENVLRIDDLKTRLFGARIYVEVEIAVDAYKTLVEAHDIAEKVHLAIETHFPNVKHCMVHVNPMLDEEKNENEETVSN